MKVSEEVLRAIKRKRGELNISVVELSKETGVGRQAIDRLLNGQSNNIRPTTNAKLVDWLAKNS